MFYRAGSISGSVQGQVWINLGQGKVSLAVAGDETSWSLRSLQTLNPSMILHRRNLKIKINSFVCREDLAANPILDGIFQHGAITRWEICWEKQMLDLLRFLSLFLHQGCATPSLSSLSSSHTWLSPHHLLVTNYELYQIWRHTYEDFPSHYPGGKKKN